VEAAVQSPTGSHPLLKRQGSLLPQSKNDTPVFRSSNDSRTRNRRPANRPSCHINSLAGQVTPLACEAGAVSPPSYRPRQKRCATLFKFISFSFSSLSLSCHRDRERGYFEKDHPQRRKRAPSPPTDQGFEGCALRGSATAPEHSGSEPFTDQGFKGWPLKRVRQPSQSTQSQG
jgi:hypothetical protein